MDRLLYAVTRPRSRGVLQVNLVVVAHRAIWGYGVDSPPDTQFPMSVTSRARAATTASLMLIWLRNLFSWALASLASGGSAKFTVTVKASKAGTALVLAVAASQNADPKP